MQLSIVICSYNRANYIYSALESLRKQEIDKNLFEIIVVDNNSTDNTLEIVKKFETENPDLNFIYTTEQNQGLSFARNKGIETAKGEIIVFIDDDAVAREDFAKNLLSHFGKYTEYAAVGGKVIPIFETGEEPAWMSKYLERLVSKVDYGDTIQDFTTKYPVGCNMAFRKSVFEKIGTFNTSLNLRSDDKYIFRKIFKAKLRVLYAPDVFVRHHIEKERTTDAFLIRLSRLNGRSERIRVKTENGNFKTISVFFAYIFKIAAAYILFFKFIFEGKKVKGKYLIRIMQNTFYGFLFYEKVIEYLKKK
jgi:glycosyltransferase involved in cell wall biosynthesis